jgi:hypothetical protein
LIIEITDDKLEYIQSIYDDVKDAKDNYYLNGYRTAMELMALQLGIPLKIKKD